MLPAQLFTGLILAAITVPDTSARALQYRFGHLMYMQKPIGGDPPDPIYQTEHCYYDGVRRVQEVIDKPEVPPSGDPPAGGSPADEWTEREYVYGPEYVDEFVLQEDDPGLLTRQLIYMLQDANYNVVALLDDAGNLLAQYTYEPYGTRIFADEPGMTPYNENAAGHQGLFIYRLTQGASPLAPETIGIYYNRNRWYSPALGRFLQRDPNEAGQLVIGALISNGETLAAFVGALSPSGHFGDGMNLYLYALGNPITGSDALGLYDPFADVDEWIDDRIGNALYTLGTLNEQATLGLNVAMQIASMMLGLDVLDSVVLIAQGKGGFWDAMNIVLAANPIGRTAKLIKTGQKWMRRANRAGRLAGAFAKWLGKGSRNVKVYVGYRNGRAVYVGISKNVGRRASQHGKRFDYLDEIVGGRTRNEAGSIEQAIIERNPHFENKINSISPNSEFYNDALGWGENYLDGNGVPSYYP